MKKNSNLSSFNKKRIVQALFFIASVTITVYFFPREEKFRYHFQEGKPWNYGLLTASFDFPIYKSDAQIQHEEDSILQNFHPYYKQNNSIETQQLESWKSYYEKSLQSKIPASLYHKISNSLKQIYSKGIVSLSEYENLRKKEISAIKIANSDNANLNKIVPLESILSIRTAYDSLIKSMPNEYEQNIAQTCNLNKFLSENLQQDSVLTKRVKSELIKRISASAGMVQAGQRIVDRGEVINPHTYQILKSLEKVTLKNEVKHDKKYLTLTGEIIVSLILFGFMYMFLYLFRPKVFNNLRSLLFLLIIVLGITIFSYIAISSRLLGIYLIPFAILPIIICTFLDSRIALFTSIITILLSAFFAPFPLEFVFLQTLVSMVSMFTLRDLTKRSQLVRCAIFVFFTYCIAYCGYVLVIEGSWNKINPNMFLYFSINCTLLLFAYLLIYLLEKLFGFTSTVTLVELSDINTPILRQLSELCPGTFQHSLQVSNLAAEAANKIGANAQLVRTGALYHDIGKMKNPVFFTENQSSINPHDKLTYEQSAQIIIQHVNDGLKMAEKLMLPLAVKQFISSHHGTGLAKFFYNSFKNQYPDKEVDKALFAYPGPNPNTKETAILMMADTVEAASRSLKTYTEESISQLVETLIDQKISEGLLKDSPISLHEIEIIKAVFIDKLKTMYHTRISYPKLNNDEISDPGKQQSNDIGNED